MVHMSSNHDLYDHIERIILAGHEAYKKNLIAGRGGNISVRLNDNEYLITAHKAALGFLGEADFIIMNMQGEKVEGPGKPSTEARVHTAIYQQTDAKAVVHLHPPYINLLTAHDIPFTPLTFESRVFLGNTPPVVPQDGPTVTNTERVTEALDINNIIIIKKHGTVAVADTVMDAYFLTDMAEEAAKMSYLALTLKNEPAAVRTRTENRPAGQSKTYPVFSDDHINAMVDIINNDEEAQRLGKSTQLTVNYAIKLIEENKVCNMHFVDGKIVEVTDTEEGADFVNAGRRKQWVAVFNGLIDPFVATTQKKLRLQKGHIGDLSKWYPPFYRIFDLWKQTPVE